MAESILQSELFAGEDWTVLYRAFANVNFNAYDFHTIRQAMVDYISNNYAEDFNDWVHSSEFVAYLDLLAYLGQSLAFRMDLNARENFIDTAERRESILRLARYLGYTPKRNYPANGLVKLIEIRVNQDLYDSQGRNINGIPIRWNNSNDPDWFEHWLLVFNAIAVPSNPFGVPLKNTVLDGITTQLYRFNNLKSVFGTIPFGTEIDGRSVDFEIINVDFDTKKHFFEREPNPSSAMHVIYRNDGNGNSSANTGFFLMFKQGALAKSDFLINDEIENRSIDIDVSNINETDVWVQNVKENGDIDTEGSWERVGVVPQDSIYRVYMNSDNPTYNSFGVNIRKLFQVVTRENDNVTIKFGDGRFAKIPLGNMRVWYRTSLGTSYTIKPDDMRNISINLPYSTSQKQNRLATLTFALQENVNNSSPAETNEQIKRRAGQLWATQGRMVTGEDYNIFPQQSNLALKIKAVNRYYSGQSRFIDLSDPTGNYNSTNTIADDGALYFDTVENVIEVPFTLSRSSQEIVTSTIVPLLTKPEIRDFLHNEWLRTHYSDDYKFAFQSNHPRIYWKPSRNHLYSASGYFVYYDQVENPPGSGNLVWQEKPAHPGIFGVNTPLDYLSEGCLIKFRESGWVTVLKYSKDTSSSGVYTNYVDGFQNYSNEGAIVLNESVQGRGDEYDLVDWILPAIHGSLATSDQQTIKETLEQSRTFGLGYDFENREWYYIDTTEIASTGEYDWNSRKSSGNNSWLIKVEHTPENWRILYRTINYVFESEKNCSFLFINKYAGIDPETHKTSSDRIIISSSNGVSAKTWKSKEYYKFGNVIKTINYTDSGLKFYTYYMCVKDHISGWHYYSYDNIGKKIPSYWSQDPQTIPSSDYFSDFPDGTLFDGGQMQTDSQPVWREVTANNVSDHVWKIDSPFVYPDGYVEPRRVLVSGYDSDNDGQLDNPQSFLDVVSNDDWVILSKYQTTDGFEYYKLNPSIKVLNIDEPIPTLQPKEVVFFFETVNRSRSYISCDNSTNKFLESKIGSLGFWMYNRKEPGKPVLNSGTVFGSNNYRKLSESPNKANPFFLNLEKTGRAKEHQAFPGKMGLKFQWKHYASLDHRVDPAVSNLIDVYVLDKGYHETMLLWKKQGADASTMPQAPSELQLRVKFHEIEQYKMFSDEIVWRPVKYRLLFGNGAEPKLQARFKVVKVRGTSMSDGEIKTEIVNHIEDFFAAESWDFGQTFFVSLLTGYIHKVMPTVVNSFAIVPRSDDQSFGDLFEIRSNADEIFFPIVTVDDIDIISSNTSSSLRISHAKV